MERQMEGGGLKKSKDMDNNVFSLLLLSGLFGLSQQKDFFYVPETKTWQDAQTYCREMYTDLATIENIHEYEKARGNVDKLYLGNVWIGLKKEVDIHWGWALGENTLSQFSLWAQNQPDNGFLDGHCGAMDQGSHWYAINCLSNNNFICYNELDGKFYYYFRALVTWKAAQSYCRMYHTDLASIRNSNESSRVSSFSLTPGYVWLGLFADSWSWSDHSSSSFRYWGVENKVTSLNYSVCAVMDMNDLGLWKSSICDTKLPFLCYKVTSLKKRQIVEVKVSSDGNKDLNDPLVKADILKQIDKKLRGMTSFSNLSWIESDGTVFSPYVEKRSFTDGL